MNDLYLNYPIITLPDSRQRRTHHKKRINKKWLKRYGWIYSPIEPDKVLFADGKFYMTKETCKKLKMQLKEKGRITE